ncbi:toxin-antitoxin system YwqK family antitoxin, partial [Porphyromonas somerae]|uniref:toxin-antitoxin system YwqK family antitoxin n=1 Tax=Porphyromonas somerae TaxID=322095 RepID=UPI00058C8465
PKVSEAIIVAKKAKVDPLTYSSPMNILNTFKQYKIKEKAIDPDTVPELSDGRTIGPPSFSIRVYKVDDTKEGQLAMRKIINTHWGEDANPWCLLQGAGKGNLSSDAWGYWNDYNAVPKRVAFKDGKLLAFCANDYDSDCWWDRQDEPHDGIPVDIKMPNDELGREATYEMSGKGKLSNPTNIRRGNKQNGVYEEWHDSGQLWYRENYKDGMLEGVREGYYANGHQSVLENYENGQLDGLHVEWYSNGQLLCRGNYKNGKLDGILESHYASGQVAFRSNYKFGQQEGVEEVFYENGSLKERTNYKQGVPHGLCEKWYLNGQMSSRGEYKDGKEEGTHEKWYKNGQPFYQYNYENGKMEGVQKEWHEDGQLFTKSTYKNGKLDGPCEEYGMDGSAIKTFYKNGVPNDPDISIEQTSQETKKKITLKPKKKGGVKI